MDLKKSRNTIFLRIIQLMAITGLLLGMLTSGGRNFGLRSPGGVGYGIVLGTLLILPYLIYIIQSKPKSKKILQGNYKDLIRNNMTVESYFDYKEKRKIVEIYVLNETGDELIIDRKNILQHRSWHIFTVKINEILYFNNGVNFYVNQDSDVEIEDFRDQTVILGGEYLDKYGVAEYVNFAFILTKPAEGDGFINVLQQ